MKTIKDLCEDLAERLALPPEALRGAVKLTAVDGRRLLIENHSGVLLYGREEIRVAAGRGALRVRGTELTMSAMNRSELLITGRLLSLDWD